MRYRYVTCDVFTARRFGGNPLAVLPDAAGLSGEEMQRIAREFNYSETTFVLPPEDPAHTRRVRIFTPGAEIPFAGHPNVGTAFVLAAIGAVPTSGSETEVVFEEGAGPVAVAIRCRDGRPVECELTAPQSLALGATPPVEAVAESVGLSPDVVVTRTHPPRVASAGLPFLCVELRDRTALAEARVRHDPHAALMRSSGAEGILLYTRDTGERQPGSARAHVRASPWRRGGSGHRQRQSGPRRPARGQRARGGRRVRLAHRPRRRDGPSELARGFGDQARRRGRDPAHRRPLGPGVRRLDRGRRWRPAEAAAPAPRRGPAAKACSPPGSPDRHRRRSAP